MNNAVNVSLCYYGGELRSCTIVASGAENCQALAQTLCFDLSELPARLKSLTAAEPTPPPEYVVNSYFEYFFIQALAARDKAAFAREAKMLFRMTDTQVRKLFAIIPAEFWLSEKSKAAVQVCAERNCQCTRRQAGWYLCFPNRL